MKAKDQEEKDLIKLRFAVALDKAMQNLEIPSVRNLSLQANMEPAHLQRIATGQVDVSLVTIITIIEALNIMPSDFFTFFDAVTDKDIKEYHKKLEKQRKEKSPRARN
jgi:hypothetical protein